MDSHLHFFSSIAFQRIWLQCRDARFHRDHVPSRALLGFIFDDSSTTYSCQTFSTLRLSWSKKGKKILKSHVEAATTRPLLLFSEHSSLASALSTHLVRAEQTSTQEDRHDACKMSSHVVLHKGGKEEIGVQVITPTVCLKKGVLCVLLCRNVISQTATKQRPRVEGGIKVTASITSISLRDDMIDSSRHMIFVTLQKKEILSKRHGVRYTDKSWRQPCMCKWGMCSSPRTYTRCMWQSFAKSHTLGANVMGISMQCMSDNITRMRPRR